MKDDDNVISEEITSDKTIWMCTEVLLFLFFLQVYFFVEHVLIVISVGGLTEDSGSKVTKNIALIPKDSHTHFPTQLSHAF